MRITQYIDYYEANMDNGVTLRSKTLRDLVAELEAFYDLRESEENVEFVRHRYGPSPFDGEK